MTDPRRITGNEAHLAWNRASILSSAGAGLAGLAGLGLGALWPQLVAGLAGLALALGLAIHVAGMVAKRRAERADRHEPRLWEQIAYWSCWIAIAVLLAWLLLRALSAA